MCIVMSCIYTCMDSMFCILGCGTFGQVRKACILGTETIVAVKTTKGMLWHSLLKNAVTIVGEERYREGYKGSKRKRVISYKYN